MQCEVTGPLVRFPAHFDLILSEEQISAREHLLTRDDKNPRKVTTTAPVEFKRGEIIVITKDFLDLAGAQAQHLSAKGGGSKKRSQKRSQKRAKKAPGKQAPAASPSTVAQNGVQADQASVSAGGA